MKYRKYTRIFVIAVVLSLLLLTIPALPALAETLLLSPAQGKVGERINYSGSGYAPSGTTEYYIDIYISDQAASISNYIGTNVTRYKRVVFATFIDEAGTYSGYFNLPSTLNEGPLGVTSPLTLVTGTSYYVYATSRYSNPDTPGTQIKAAATITVTPGATLNPLSPTSGPAGTSVSISGVNFAAGSIAVTFDSSPVQITGGSTQTVGGSFISSITIPTGTAAGTHTITVTVGTDTATATFTVTASSTLAPLLPASGVAGSDVTVSGSNFMVSYPIIFQFDSTTIPSPKSGDINTSTAGSFTSIITVPQDATAGSHTITVTVGTMSAMATFTVTASPSLGPLSPASGAAGTDVTVTGSSLMISYPIIFQFDTITLTPKSGDINTNTTGSFTSVITVPSDATAGAHTIKVTVGATALEATFTVSGGGTQPPPTSKAVLSINISGDSIGSQIGIGGAGFNPGADVTLKYDDTVISTVQANASGQVTFIFEAPPSKAGDHIITVSDGTNSATEEFTVESTPPDTPPPLLPEMGAKAKSPITFDWQDVTDVSLPVTYDLQIATDENFPAASILLEKTDIGRSELVLTETDELLLENEAGPYYWRVRAVDAASNASPWTGAGEFYVAGPVSFPNWAKYTLFGVGGVILFLLGLWVGRRTAFYY
jgi:hypothetical protein